MFGKVTILSKLSVVMLTLLAAQSRADLWMPSVFGDHMVLQAGMPLRVWGTAVPGEQVRVSIAGHSATARAGEDGVWRAKLPRLSYGGPFEMSVKAPSGSKRFSDVLVGEVWVASGQSNMQFPVNASRNAEKEVAGANFPNIRLFAVPLTTAIQPRSDCRAKWTATTPQTAAGFSAVAYFFGRELHERRGVPVGLIHTSWGGTTAEAWMSRPALEAEPKFSPILARWDDLVQKYPAVHADYEVKHAAWVAERDRAKADGKKAPKEPGAPTAPNDPNRPANLYNAMIAPIAPYTIRGAIWYQGESNAGRAYQYRSLFPAMIQNWRDTWSEGDFPFLFVQIANYMDRKKEPRESEWAELREAQTMTLSLPKTGMAVAIDIGEGEDIHPRNKQDVGKRLWYAAEKVAYNNRAAAESGPLFQSVTFANGEARVKFANARKGLKTLDGKPVTGFEVAGGDHSFVWADATIDGDTVIVKSAKVAGPVAVRYGWADNPDCNLYNSAELPASPFRTDDWPGLTVKNQ